MLSAETAMSLEIEATYENGMLKLDQQLPLQNGERVKLTVHQRSSRARASAGIFRWQGDRKDFENLLSPDNHPWNSNE
jgi:predicted DNA-binding antitoxin AbrB/MazE fold protein